MSSPPKHLYLVANWKSHKTLAEASSFLTALSQAEVNPHCTQIIAAPAPYLQPLSSLTSNSVSLAAQNLSPFPLGAYTGEIAAIMIKDWVKYVVVGHSERRRYFQESNQDVANKITQALEHNLNPIVCLDEPYLLSQLDVLDPEIIPKLIVAYEPLAAIGSGDPDTPAHAQEIATRIKDLSKSDIPVLYGGSVTPENIHSFTSLANISGALVGGASLNPLSWIDLVNSAIS